MLKEDLAELSAGTEISLDLNNLWQYKFDSQCEDCHLVHEGYLEISPNEDEEDEHQGWEYPYIDLYTDAGPVACDGETCEIVEVDPDAERITLMSRDYHASFEMDFEDAQYCVCA